MLTLPRVGDEFAGYRLLAVLGRGGMSVVFQAENPRLGSLAALKVLAPELGEDDVFRTRFLQESRTAASLNHPNVIPIYDMGTHEDLLFIAMRYVAGSDLRKLIRERRQLPPAEALYAISQAGRALDLAHRHGLVHRDVKPANILIEAGADADDPDHVYLADFGIAKHAMSSSGLTGTGQFVGTVHYVAPEQIQGHPIDGRADQYALSCVLFECLTGRAPFVRDVDAAVLWAHVEQPPPQVSALRTDLPEALDHALAKAMAKEPADRYASCRDFVVAARDALGDTDQPGRLLSQNALGGPEPRGTDPESTQPPPVNAEPPNRPSAPPVKKAPEPSPAPPLPVEPAAEEPEPDRPASHTGTPRPRRRPVLVAVAACVLAIAVAAALTWVFAHDSNSNATSQTPTTSPATNPILTAVKMLDDDRLPLASCRETADDHVSCSDPYPGVTQVDLRRYATIRALYNSYVATTEAVAGRPFQANRRNCNGRINSGEVSWNHNYKHPKDVTLEQARSKQVDPMHATGRVFCDYINDAMHFVWTDDSGRLLGTVEGYDHRSTWRWWHRVHHDLNVGYWASHGPSSSPDPSDTDMPRMNGTNSSSDPTDPTRSHERTTHAAR